MKALRIFYADDGTIIKTCGLEGPGVFPYTVPHQRIEYGAAHCLTLADVAKIKAFLSAEGSHIEDGKLVLGTQAEPSPPPPPPRELAAEIDALKAEVAKLKEGLVP